MISSTDEEPVYPSLDGFGSLDSTKISPEVKKIVDSFAQNVISWNFDESLIQKNSIFSLAMFKYDVESGWKNNFNEDFPLTAEKKLFSSYYCGEPFVDEDFLSVPLRFKTPKKFIDVQIFIDKTEDFKITQILVKKMGKINECGLFDMNRNPHPVAAAYKLLLKEFGQITVIPYGEMFEITGKAASLKTQV